MALARAADRAERLKLNAALPWRCIDDGRRRERASGRGLRDSADRRPGSIVEGLRLKAVRERSRRRPRDPQSRAGAPSPATDPGQSRPMWLVELQLARGCPHGGVGGVPVRLRVLAHLRPVARGRPEAGPLHLGHLHPAPGRSRCHPPLRQEALRAALTSSGSYPRLKPFTSHILSSSSAREDDVFSWCWNHL